MNTAILAALVLLGGTTLGVVATPLVQTAFQPECTDLAGQGTLCTDTENGVEVTLILEPQLPPVDAAASAQPTCQDLAGQGYVCADVREDGFDVEAVIAPTLPPLPPLPPVESAQPTCQDLAGQGYVCADVREDGFDVEAVIAPQIPPL